MGMMPRRGNSISNIVDISSMLLAGLSGADDCVASIVYPLKAADLLVAGAGGSTLG